MSNKKKKRQIIFQGLCLIERLSPHFLLCCVGQAVTKAISPFISLYLSAIIVNSFLAGKGMAYILMLMALMVALNLGCQSFGVIMDRWVNIKQNILIKQYNWTLNKKMTEFSFADVESHSVQAMREKIRQMEQVNNMGIWNMIIPVKTAIQSLFSILFATAIFSSLFFQKGMVKGGRLTAFFCSPWALILLFALIIGNILVSLWTVSQSTKKVFGAYAGLVPINQVYSYYLENYIDTYHSGKDIRLYHQEKLIRKEMDSLLESGQTPMKKLKRIEFKYNGIGSLATLVMNVFIYLTVGLRALTGFFPVGNIVQYIGGVNQFITGFTTLSGQLTLIGANVEAMELILRYLERKSSQIQMHQEEKTAELQVFSTGSLPTTNPIEIQFRNVSFSYPDADKKALENLSFSFRSGERIAVVGENGSGKTTMIKLLCRLYDADEGEIVLNGINIEQLDLASYWDLFGVVFQDFQLFSFSLGQNVAGSVEYDAERAEKALEKADFEIKRKEMSLETALYRDFDPLGIEVSGGEAQKISIARALYKQSSILVLDEPTAALDPKAEYEIYKNLSRVSENRTALFISHRMSSCRFCDRILVFDKGKLIQEGRHEDLLKDEQGKYYQLWSSQEQYYQ